jgi:DNA-binding response OmpR family regulator
MRVQLVDENDRLRDLARRQLRDAGVAVDAVGDLAQADAAARCR